jgi:hypothetical protein
VNEVFNNGLNLIGGDLGPVGVNPKKRDAVHSIRHRWRLRSVDFNAQIDAAVLAKGSVIEKVGNVGYSDSSNIDERSGDFRSSSEQASSARKDLHSIVCDK